MAIPRLPDRNGGGVSLPRPMPMAMARLVQQAMRDPAASLDGLQDSPILGAVLAARYLSAAGHPDVPALRDWLARYAGLPDAPAIHALLLSRLPKGSHAPAEPKLPGFAAAPPGDDLETSATLLPRNAVLDRAIRQTLRAGHTDQAVRIVMRARSISAEYGALLRAEIAQAMFSEGHDTLALRLAEGANDQAHGAVGLAPWIGGLAAWRLGRTETARTLFEAAYRSRLSSPGERAGAAFWAARASLVLQGDHGPWMRRAARDPRTFYGLLARRVLGRKLLTDTPSQQTLGEADVEAVAATPRGLRAFALLQIGEQARADAELRLLWTEMRDEPGFGRSVMLVARAAGLNDLADQLDAIMEPATLHLPARRLHPAGGYRFSPALVYALTRLESNFDSTAVSPAGARGLMQLMPVTARFLLADAKAGPPRLHDPAVNLDLGQRYMRRLYDMDLVGSNLVRLLASYNAGPGTFSHWLDGMAQFQDPLMFMAALPADETRAYVPRALAYYWLYAAQMGLPTPSLDELAAGLWPHVHLHAADAAPAVRWHG